MTQPSKSLSHGRIGEAAVYAKCWMHGIPAYHTGGLRNNFAGSDLIVESPNPRQKLWLQVKTGAPTLRNHVYLTQASGPADLESPKFASDFVVFVNLSNRTAKSHRHDGTLSFEHLSFYVVPVNDANRIFKKWFRHWGLRPKRDGGVRKLGNSAVHVPDKEMQIYRDAWELIKVVAAGKE